MQKFFSDTAAFVAREKKRRLWIAAVLVLACAVVLATVCALIRPAAALEAPVTYCGKEEHTHTDACYTRELTCGQEESAGHTHTDACYEMQTVLICGQEESEEHTHTDACYEKQPVLICGQEESAGHTHTDECYSNVLTCGKEEHTHTEACFVDPNADATETDGSDSDTSTTGDNAGAAGAESDESEPVSEPEPLENAPTVSNDILTRAANFNTSTTYAIVYKEWAYAMTSDFKGKGVEINSGDNPITINGNADEIAIWTLQEKNNGYCIKFSDAQDDKPYLAVNTGDPATLKLSRSTKTWYFNQQWDGTYKIYCETSKRYYYLTCDEEGQFTVTTNSNAAASFYFVEKANITSSGESSGGGTQGTVEGLTPSGTVINLFDYSVAQDVSEEMDQPNYPNSGINKDHALKFTTGAQTEDGTVNKWTGASGGVLQGIVDNTLDDGYPVLSGDEDIFDPDQIYRGDHWDRNPFNDLDFTESLRYLFDPEVKVEDGGNSYKASYSNVGGLLQIDDEGYYYYDCSSNYAEFNKSTNQFTLYDDWKLEYQPTGGELEQGQFFPFMPYDQVGKHDRPNNDHHYNYYFGMTLTTRFVQDYGGHTDSTKKKATTFEFSGDDDVWIFIDDVLVADLGGIHLAADVDINFADGTVYINKVYENGTVSEKTIDLSDAFKAAKKIVSNDTGWVQSNGKWIFADDTYHTLKFFYLERGGFASNMMVKYNLKSIPASSIVKVDQYGNKVANAEFALYAAEKAEDGTYRYKVDNSDETISLEDGTYQIEKGVIKINGDKTISPIYYGATKSDGSMTFVDGDGMPLALNDLQEKGGTSHFILREVKIPDGYRVVDDEVWMYLEGGVLYADNTYDSGAWAAANALVTATDTIYLNDTSALENGHVASVIQTTASDASVVDGQVKLSYYDLATEKTEVTGTLFAVVLKYTGAPDMTSMQDQANWVPVYGNELQGYLLNTVESPGDRTSFVNTVIDTAQKMEANPDYGDSVFTLGSSGSMQVLITQLPDDMKSYYSVLLKKYDGSMGQIAQELGYTVAYYWTTADSINEATADNTFRVHAEAATNYDGFERTFGASIEVPNLVNRLFVQKIGEDASQSKEPINDAVFALYSVTQEDDIVYYLAEDNTEIQLGKANQNKGTATVKGSSAQGTYTIDATSGVITVQMSDKTYSITPKSVQKTSDTTGTKEGGTAEFTNTAQFTFTQGTYCVREISAPAGYKVNNTEIQVLVDDTTIYANAGTATDGVSVGRGPGYVVKPLLKSAAYDDIDNTLTWVYAQMKVTGESTKFADAYNAKNGQPVTEYSGQGFNAITKTDGTAALKSYLTYDPSNENTLFNYTVNKDQKGGTGTRRLFTSVGWSAYEVFQDYDYGKDHKKANAEYTNLQNKDISNLFSQSVYIQVEDARVSKLKVSKTMEVEQGSEAPQDNNPLFTFTVGFYEANSSETDLKKLTGTYPYTIYKSEDNTTVADTAGRYSSGTIASGETIQLHKDEYVVIEELPYNAQYQVNETQLTGYTPTYKVDNGTENSGSSTGMKSLTWTATDQTTTVDFTNTYKEVEPVNLTLIKVESGNDTQKLPGAEFVLYQKDANGTVRYYSRSANTTSWESLAGQKTESDYQLTTDNAGKISFVGLTEGTYYLKELKAPDGYILLTDEITFTVQTDGTITTTGNYSVPGNAPDFTIQVSNSAGISLPETGGTGIMAYTCGGLLLMAAATMYGVALRRKREGRGK